MFEILSGIAGWRYFIALSVSLLFVFLIGLQVKLPKKYRDTILDKGIVHLTLQALTLGG